MRLIALTLLLLPVLGCTTLQDRIEENVHVGDGYSHVKTALGSPNYITDLPEINGGVLVYRSYKHICEIYLKRGYVTGADCKANPNYESPVVVGLKAAGDSLSHAHDNTYNCTDFNNGNYTCWNRGRASNCTRFGDTFQCH